MTDTVWLQVFIDGTWRTAARITNDDPAPGYEGRCVMEYEADYITSDYGLPYEQPGARVALNYPVNFDMHNEQPWPAFLLDIMPGGAGRRYHLGHLNIPNNRAADWPLLRAGARNPVGNVRVVPDPQWTRDLPRRPRGFPFDAVLERQQDFLEYAAREGAEIGGSSDVQGDAPKMLLTQDADGQFHPDGALADADARVHWLVKFPRGDRTMKDRQVLRTEAAYLRVAERLGFKAISGHQYERDTLLVPRFDRIVSGGGVQRLGLESVCSLCQVSEYGARIEHQRICQVLFDFCTEDRAGAVLEYACRDALNVALGNTDNHPRNAAVLKYRDSRVKLAPWYDFAPMYLDPTGVIRSCRWGDLERGGDIDWAGVRDFLGTMINDVERVTSALAHLGAQMRDLPALLGECGVEDEIIQQRRMHIEGVGKSLRALKTNHA